MKIKAKELKRAILVGLALMATSAAWTTSVLASESRWWPAVRTIPASGSLGLAGSPAGGFLLVDSGGNAATENTLYCDPSGRSTIQSYVTPYAFNPVGLRNVVPGSPSFAPDGSSLVISLQGAGTISKPIFASEGSSEAPQQLGVDAETLFTSNMGSPRYLVVATGTDGETAVAGDIDYRSVALATRSPGESWKRQWLEAFSKRLAVAVDGLGDVVLLGNTYQTAASVELANAYFERPGGRLERLAVPGSYFTAVAASSKGAEAIAGYAPTGPLGAGLYLSRRESPNQPFSPPVLISGTSGEQAPQLDYDASGTLTVAWTEANNIDVASASTGAQLSAPQSISTPGYTTVSDEQLAVDASGEAVLAWSAGPHEMRSSYPLGAGLWGSPTSLYASVRSSATGLFVPAQSLTTSALYNEGVNSSQFGLEGVRVTDAITGGRALVAWSNNSVEGPYVQVARYAASAGCAVPSGSAAGATDRPRMRWSHHPRRRRHSLSIGEVTCPTACQVVTRAVAIARHGALVAQTQLRVPAGATRTAALELTRRGRRLASRGSKLTLKITVAIRVQGQPTTLLHKRFKGPL